MNYFHITEHLNYKKDKCNLANRIAFKNLCELLVKDNHIFEKIQNILL